MDMLLAVVTIVCFTGVYSPVHVTEHTHLGIILILERMAKKLNMQLLQFKS